MKSKFHWFVLIFTAVTALVTVLLYNTPYLFKVGTVELIIIAIVVNTFVIIYSRRNWRANPYGRALMYSKISLAILADLSLVTGLLGPNWSGRGLLRIFVFGIILIAQTRLLQLLFSAKVRNDRKVYDEIHKGD